MCLLGESGDSLLFASASQDQNVHIWSLTISDSQVLVCGVSLYYFNLSILL